MCSWRRIHPFVLGILLGLGFGSINLIYSWLYPVADDTPGALLRFYGPMFSIWALSSFGAARRSGRVLSGVTTGLTVAFGTFIAFDFFVVLRLNLFLNDLAGRADWQNMVARINASESGSLRWFVNLDYLTGIPLKLAVSCAIGALMGSVGGVLGQLTNRSGIARA